MSRNRHKHANAFKMATIAWWLIVFAVLCGIGLSYVYLKNQTIAFGEQRRSCERDLKDLASQNRALASQITALTSHSALKKQLGGGFFNMKEITENEIVRLTAENTAVVADNQSDDALLTPTFAQK